MFSQHIAWRLMIRDIKTKYRQSLFGFLWIILPPIASAAGLAFASNAKIINIGETDIPYPAFVLFSMTIWQIFVQAVNAPINGTSMSKGLLTKVSFPSESIVLARVGELLFDFLPRFALIAVTFIFFQISITWSILLTPVSLLNLIILGIEIGLILAPFSVLYQDVVKVIGPLMASWLFITPVIYPVPQEGTLRILVNLNPVTPLLVATRELATTGGLSNPFGFWIASIFVLAFLPLAWLFYKVSLPFALEKISS